MPAGETRELRALLSRWLVIQVGRNRWQYRARAALCASGRKVEAGGHWLRSRRGDTASPVRDEPSAPAVWRSGREGSLPARPSPVRGQASPKLGPGFSSPFDVGSAEKSRFGSKHLGDRSRRAGGRGLFGRGAFLCPSHAWTGRSEIAPRPATSPSRFQLRAVRGRLATFFEDEVSLYRGRRARAAEPIPEQATHA